MLISIPVFAVSSEDDENDPESLASSSAPNTSALETLVRTACESLAVSTLLAGSSSASINPLNASGQQMPSKNPAAAQPTSDIGTCEVTSSSSTGSNLYPVSTSALDQASTDDAVFSVIFGHDRVQSVAEGTSEEQGSLSSSKELQESRLDLSQESLSDIGDAEVFYLYMYIQ